VDDTLYGVGESHSSGPEHAYRHAVALADVDHLAIRKGDAARTTLLVLGSAALAGVGYVIYLAATIPED
jgi:hypothetical protein